MRKIIAESPTAHAKVAARLAAFWKNWQKSLQKSPKHLSQWYLVAGEAAFSVGLTSTALLNCSLAEEFAGPGRESAPNAERLGDLYRHLGHPASAIRQYVSGYNKSFSKKLHADNIIRRMHLAQKIAALSSAVGNFSVFVPARAASPEKEVIAGALNLIALLLDRPVGIPAVISGLTRPAPRKEFFTQAAGLLRLSIQACKRQRAPRRAAELKALSVQVNYQNLKGPAPNSREK